VFGPKTLSKSYSFSLDLINSSGLIVVIVELPFASTTTLFLEDEIIADAVGTFCLLLAVSFDKMLDLVAFAVHVERNDAQINKF